MSSDISIQDLHSVMLIVQKDIRNISDCCDETTKSIAAINTQLSKNGVQLENLQHRMEDCEHRIGRVEENMDDKLKDIDKKIEDFEVSISDLVAPFQKIIPDLATINQSLIKHRQIIEKQQRFLDIVDARARGNNLVVIGIPETDDSGAAPDDGTKLGVVFKACGVDNARFTYKRLGAKTATCLRPLLVTLADIANRVRILENKHKLKSVNDFSKVFIKKDSHPLVRAEWKRLYDIMRSEKNKIDNENKEISIKDGKLYVGDTVVDEFHRPTNSPFR